MKSHKGYWLHLFLETGESHEISGINSLSEALYLVKRRYIETPHLFSIDLYVNTKLLEHIQVEEGKPSMSKLSDFRAQLESKGQSLDAVPTMKAEDRALFMKGCVPFFVTAVNEASTQFGNSLVYSIQTDTTSREYGAVGKALDIQPEYKLFVPDTKARRHQWKTYMEDYIADRTRLILINPEGKTPWDFEEYEG